MFDGPKPLIHVEQIEDDSKFDCPKPWLLMLTNIGLSMLYAMTVCGAFFFMMAAPQRVTPKCWDYEWQISRVSCSAMALACWTYPLVCILTVGLVFAKQMLDARLYYELLLTKILIDYESAKFWHSPTVIMIILWGCVALCNFAWMFFSGSIGISYALAYITPVMSFMIMLSSNWSIDGHLIPLPRFYGQDYRWAVDLLQKGKTYTMKQLELGYLAAEEELILSGATVSSDEMIALIVRHAPAKDDSTHFFKVMKGGAVYWVARLLCFSPHLHDTRSREYRRWARIYMAYLTLLVGLVTVLLACTIMTCSDLLHLIDLEKYPKLWWMQIGAVETARRQLRHRLGLIQVVGHFATGQHPMLRGGMH